MNVLMKSKASVSIVVVMITMDRSPRGKENYLPDTLENFKRAGVLDSPHLHSFHVFDSGGRSGWLESELQSVGLASICQFHLGGNYLACENAGRALIYGSQLSADWVLFCEDDLDLCSDFLGSVARWLSDHADNRYSVYTFGTPYSQVQWCVERGLPSWEYPVQSFYGTQCFAIRPSDALSLGSYISSNPTIRGVVNPNAYDLMFHDWMAENHPDKLFLASCPSFVQHIGGQSICTGKETTHTFGSWPGRDWSYKSSSSPVEIRDNRPPSVLWIGDAAVSTGFARCTHAVCDHLHSHGWTVNVCGMGYYGDPHSYPYPIYPSQSRLEGATSYGGEMRLPLLLDKLNPDVVVILQDPWNIKSYFDYLDQVRQECVSVGSLFPKIPPIVGWLAVDAKNHKGQDLNRLSHVVTWTEFGRDELAIGGYIGPSSVVPLGVDTSLFKPLDKLESRKRCLPSIVPLNSYIVGYVGRNQPRKRLDLLIEYFAEWVNSTGIENAYLYLHTAPTGERSCDINSLARYYGVNKQIIVAEPSVGKGDPESAMPHVYNSFDVFLTTTQGEGWGLPVLEAMACGVPCVLPDWSGLGDWTQDAAIKIPCTSTALTAPLSSSPYTVGGVPDKLETVKALHRLYKGWIIENARYTRRENIIDRGLKLAQSLSWDRTANEFRQVLETVLGIEKCEWPGCFSRALCQSGNFANKFVCSDHFDITNGPGFGIHVIEELSDVA